MSVINKVLHIEASSASAEENDSKDIEKALSRVFNNKKGNKRTISKIGAKEDIIVENKEKDKQKEPLKLRERSPSIEFVAENNPNEASGDIRAGKHVKEDLDSDDELDESEKSNPNFPLILIKSWEREIRRDINGVRKSLMKNLPVLPLNPLQHMLHIPEKVEVDTDSDVEIIEEKRPDLSPKDPYIKIKCVFNDKSPSRNSREESKVYNSSFKRTLERPSPPPRSKNPSKQRQKKGSSTKRRNLRGLEHPEGDRSMLCKDCGKYFSKYGLGGHRAKFHAGENPGYKIKLQIRRRNEEKRTILRLAQFLYFQKYDRTDIHPKDINRSLLCKLKKKIENDDALKEQLINCDYIEFLRKKRASFLHRDK
ncbi:unnamed protein product [Moneuplotes crassus]|uniref:C2H2-type domain-containing protein n=1 Tax=Euplotes crassus TaxID=5936 RepID=A0AAD1UCH6_EUPCR|nr:unnamed protein product [Moneuplotes crassus]